MTVLASRQTETGFGATAAVGLGLSARLILLTMGFVLLAEVLVFLPSAAGFRRSWLGDRVAGAQMLALALTTAGPALRTPEQERELLSGITGAQAIGVLGPQAGRLLAAWSDRPPEPDGVLDLRDESWLALVAGALRLLVGPARAAVRVIGPGGPLPDRLPGISWVDLVLDEAPLRRALLNFTRDFLLASLLISGFTGALLYCVLHVLVVRPVRRLADNVAAFASNPEDGTRVIRPSGRRDEVGRAEEVLAHMETALAGELRQKRHLADLGLAVSKINHELRNMLTTAQLLGDRLGAVEDPTVRRIAPRLVKTLARAVDFCGATLAYGRAAEPAPQRRLVPLRPLVEEQLGLVALSDGLSIRTEVAIADSLLVDADPDQLARVVLNLVRNAVEALTRADAAEPRITVEADRDGGTVWLRVTDTGPGVPERIRDRLFTAFQASDRVGGTGLGLPVADEILRLHGGTIALERSGAGGTSFAVRIPDRRDAGVGRTPERAAS